MHSGGVVGHWRSPLVVGTLAAALAVVTAGCGTAPGAGQRSGQTGQDPAAQDPPGQAVAPTTDDPSLLTVDAPQLTTLDTAQASGVTGLSSATGADGLAVEVVSAECAVPGVRSDGYSVRAAGQFCLVVVDVVNRGAEAAAFDPARTALVDAEGGVSAPSQEALALPALAALAVQVPAATTLEGTLAFDVPTGADPRELQVDGRARAALPLG